MQRIGDILRSFLAGKLSSDDERAVELVSASREIRGDAGRHARVRDIRGRTLVLEVDHPGWAQLVGMRKAEILRRLGEAVPGFALRELRVVVGAGPGRPARPGKRRAAGPPSAKEAAELGAALSEVSDEKLRRALRELYEKARIDTGDKPGV
jgi:predicted nucleic acid-binding Zn ribbon protein